MTPSSPLSIANRFRYGVSAVLLAATLAGLGGCATGPNPHDPLEPFNRKVMQFNEGVDAVALKPAATVYRQVLPPMVRTGVSNFFGNLGDAWSFVNSALQLHLQDAAENFMRFNVNTVFGLGGILDIASDLHIERHKEDFGQTLGRWGVPPGPYLVLPLLGSSTVRDALALPIDRKGDPVHYLDSAGQRNSLYVLRAVDIRSNLLRASSVLDEAALDKYSFTRDAYLQRRRAQIFDAQKPDRFIRAPGSDGKEPDSDGKEPDLDGKEPDAGGQIPPLPESTPPPPAAGAGAPSAAPGAH
jgi:phospholipid-binding lipoprotein MlaA